MSPTPPNHTPPGQKKTLAAWYCAIVWQQMITFFNSRDCYGLAGLTIINFLKSCLTSLKHWDLNLTPVCIGLLWTTLIGPMMSHWQTRTGSLMITGAPHNIFRTKAADRFNGLTSWVALISLPISPQHSAKNSSFISEGWYAGNAGWGLVKPSALSNVNHVKKGKVDQSLRLHTQIFSGRWSFHFSVWELQGHLRRGNKCLLNVGVPQNSGFL